MPYVTVKLCLAPSHACNQVLQFRKECRGQSVLAALWRGYRTKHYGVHAKALRAKRARAGLPEDPPPFGSNRMIKRDHSVLLTWAAKKAALEKRLHLPSHETLLQQHARKRAWAQQRSDDKPAAMVHWSTRALLKTVKSYDDMRPDVMRSPKAAQSKRKDDKAVGEFSLQWLRGVGAWGWVQFRVVLQLQSLFRCVLLLFCIHLERFHSPSVISDRSQVASCEASAGAHHQAQARRCTNTLAGFSTNARRAQRS